MWGTVACTQIRLVKDDEMNISGHKYAWIDSIYLRTIVNIKIDQKCDNIGYLSTKSWLKGNDIDW